MKKTLNKKILIILTFILTGAALVNAETSSNISQAPMIKNLNTQEVFEPTLGIKCQIINNQNIVQNDVIKQYIRNMRRQILLNLKYRPSCKESVMIQARLNPDGRFTNCNIVKASQDSSFSLEAKNAVMNTRLKPLPQDFKKLYLDLSITIVSNSEY